MIFILSHYGKNEYFLILIKQKIPEFCMLQNSGILS